MGQEEISPPLGSVSLNDFEKVNGRRRFKKTLPLASHIAIGVPNREMKTCRKIKTSVGNLFRDGGFYIRVLVVKLTFSYWLRYIRRSRDIATQ